MSTKPTDCRIVTPHDKLEITIVSLYNNHHCGEPVASRMRKAILSY